MHFLPSSPAHSKSGNPRYNVETVQDIDPIFTIDHFNSAIWVPKEQNLHCDNIYNTMFTHCYWRETWTTWVTTSWSERGRNCLHGWPRVANRVAPPLQAYSDLPILISRAYIIRRRARIANTTLIYSVISRAESKPFHPCPKPCKHLLKLRNPFR